MGLAVRRRNQRVGKTSNVMVIPAGTVIGEESTIAVNRLILADPWGEIPERKLLEFLEDEVEAKFWEWYKKREESGSSAR